MNSLLVFMTHYLMGVTFAKINYHLEVNNLAHFTIYYSYT